MFSSADCDDLKVQRPSRCWAEHWGIDASRMMLLHLDVTEEWAVKSANPPRPHREEDENAMKTIKINATAKIYQIDICSSFGIPAYVKPRTREDGIAPCGRWGAS